MTRGVLHHRAPPCSTAMTESLGHLHMPRLGQGAVGQPPAPWHQHLTSSPGGRPGIPKPLCVDESRVPVAGQRKRESAVKQCSKPAGFLRLCVATAAAPAPLGIHSGLFLNPRPGPQHSAQPVSPGQCPFHWGSYWPCSWGLWYRQPPPASPAAPLTYPCPRVGPSPPP